MAKFDKRKDLRVDVMENNLLKVKIESRKGIIEILDKRTQKIWNGNPLALLTYWDVYENPVILELTEDGGWQIISKEENDKIVINYFHPELELFLDMVIELVNEVVKVTIPASTIQEKKTNQNRLKNIRLLPQFGDVKRGEEGYIALPFRSGGFCEFNDKEPGEYCFDIYGKIPQDIYGRPEDINGKGLERCNMPIFGLKNKKSAFVGIIEGGMYNAQICLGVNQGRKHLYYVHPCFNLRCHYSEERLNDDIRVEYHFLTGKETSYVDMAKRYRNYLLSKKKVMSLKERARDNPILDYSAHALEVRIRCGLKPCPSEVEEQTPENEPEMKINCTFRQIGEIIQEFKRQEIDKVEFCLVGWNFKGHDGRYPQIFPVEPELGGEEELKKLIEKARDMGYQIICHNNYHDAYRISEDWNEEYIIKKHNGRLLKGEIWSGGRSYLICPKRAYELFAKRNMQKVRTLGFQGLHYIDCMSIAHLDVCYHLAHPLKKREFAEWRCKILKLAQKIFGGVQSEGPLDFTAGCLDRVMYIEPRQFLDRREYVDREIPFYEIVYHGVLIYTVSTDVINSFKGEKPFLKTIEYGGMPLIYFYGHHRTKGEQSFGRKRDFHYNRDEKELGKNIAEIKEVYEEVVKKLGYLQTEFIEDHKMLAEDVFQTAYSDGSRVIVNYSGKIYTGKEYVIQPYSYLLLKPEQNKYREKEMETVIRKGEIYPMRK